MSYQIVIIYPGFFVLCGAGSVGVQRANFEAMYQSQIGKELKSIAPDDTMSMIQLLSQMPQKQRQRCYFEKT